MLSRQPPTPYLIITIGILAVSTASLFIRFAQQEAHSLTIAAVRLSLASLILLPIAIRHFRPELSGMSGRDWWLVFGSGGFLAIHFATWILSLAYTSIASSIVLVATMPVWVAILAPLLLKEPLTRAALAGLAITTLGALVIGVSDSCASLLTLDCPPLQQLWSASELSGNLLALLGALSGAGYLLIGRDVRQRLSIIPYITAVYSIAAILLVTLALSTGQRFSGFSPAIYGWMILLAIIPQLIGHSSFNYALGKLPASFVSVTLLGEPLGTMLLAYIILDEQPGYTKAVGAILIFTGILIAAKSPSKQNALPSSVDLEES